MCYTEAMFNLFRREKRRFFRHPVNMPIQLRLEKADDTYVSESKDISLGGLSFVWPSKLSKGLLLTVSIPVKEKVFDVRARVAYCKGYGKTNQYRTGVMFTSSPDAFKAKLAEEVLHIIEYQKSISRELGVELSEEEAAKKWISRYAGKF